MTPKVTIVTPSFNQVDYIEHTILSVINQDYTNIEYIIFDGGSNDGSIDIIKKYENKIHFWVSEPDKGQSDAINKGWKMAKGDILFYLNSDDCLHNTGVVSAIVSKYLDNPNAAVFYGDCVVINEKGDEIDYKKAKLADSQILLKERIFANIMFQTASFFNAKYVREIGFLNVDLHYCMDYMLILQLSYMGKMSKLDAPIAYFRIHKQSKSHKGMMPMMQELIQIKWKYNKIYALIYAFYYFKFFVFLHLPKFLQAKINVNLYKILHK